VGFVELRLRDINIRNDRIKRRNKYRNGNFHELNPDQYNIRYDECYVDN